MKKRFYTKEEIKDLFPLEANITEDIISTANIHDTENCTGAKTLKSVVPSDMANHIIWGDFKGIIFSKNGARVTISTSEDISMMGTTKPTKVTFIIRE